MRICDFEQAYVLKVSSLYLSPLLREVNGPNKALAVREGLFQIDDGYGDGHHIYNDTSTGN